MTNSPNIAAIVAHVDSLGYLRCVQCHTNSERKSDFAVFADNSAFHGDACDSCHKSFAPKPQPIWITRGDLYDRMVAAQNACWAHGKPQEFDGALPFIDTEAAFIAHVDYAERKAAQVVSL